MKTKYLLIQLLFLCVYTLSFAQQTSSSVYYNPIVHNGLTRIEHNNSGSNNIDLSEVKGSPYEMDNFQSGKVINQNTGKPEIFYLRYNVYNDVIELKTEPNGKISNELIKSEKIYAIINNKEYRYKKYPDRNSNPKEGYFILLKKGNYNSLYLKKLKKFKDKILPKDNFEKEKPATFTDDKAFYIQKGDAFVEIPSRKKKFLEQYPKISKELNKYLKSEKINLKSEKDLIQLFNYMDTLLE
ncbi:MAG: hypothetical protein ABFR32_01940 [Bacteroidota bacterium]